METLIYLGKVNVYWILFYACYWLLFRKHTFFVWNRFYLLGSLLVSFALPLIHFPDNARVLPTAVYAVSAIPIYVSTPESTKLALHWTQFVWAVQIIGAALMFVKLLEGFRDLFRLIGQGDEIPMEDHTLVLLPHNEIGSFSFLKWLVVNRADYEKHFDPILRHEAVHIRQLHSLDILLAELLKIFFWFNPAIWLYKRSLQEVHEFLADEEAPNRDHYANFLVSYALSAPIASLTNHFFNSSMLKKRIVMIYKNRNSDWALGKYFLILPLIGLVVMLTGARERLLNAVERKDYKILSAQNIPVEGTVSDENGKPVKAASVVVKGTTKGTSTDQNGKFKFADIAIGSTLIISHINFETFAIEINGSAALDQIVLRKRDNMLSEVTVQSYVRKKDTPETESQNGKFTVVEREPQFPGGIEELGKFLSSTIIYPSEAAKDRVQGKVFVSFTVNENGFVRDPHIIKGIGAGLDEEALRVVLKMPRWEPGKQGGEAIAVQYSLPINFQIAPDTEKAPAKFYNYSTPSNQQGLNQAQDLKSGQGKAAGYGAETISSGGQYSASYKTLPIRTTQNLQSAAGTKIAITVTESLTSSNKPLMVIDGKIDENASLDKIAPETIESVNILKGANATSIYGLKGSHGVVIINSKKK